MKKNFRFLPLFAVLLLHAFCINAQSKASSGNYAALSNTASARSRQGMYLNDINIKAKRDFKNEYKDVSNERWCISSEGIITARFELNGCTTVVYYEKSGKWTATLKNYTENQLPFAIRDQVKRKYYDFSIEVVDEVLTSLSNKTPTYIVHIRYKNHMKFIRINDDEMEVWKEFDVS
ncbi:MAG: hypothetical protein QM802_05000 [Agriterribacter sp.]